MTKILPNEQTLQLGSDGPNKIQMHTIRGNHLWLSFYHRGPELSSDNKPCRAILCFGESAWQSSHARAATLVSPALLHSIWSKSPRVNPRNARTWCRISHERLSKSNHALTQQTTHLWSQHKTNISSHTPKAGDPTPDHCLEWRGWSLKLCWDPTHCFKEGFHQRQKIKELEAKTRDWQDPKGKLLVSENGSSLTKLNTGADPGLMFKYPILPGQLSRPLAEHLPGGVCWIPYPNIWQYLPLIHRPSNTREQWLTPSHLSATGSYTDCLSGHTLCLPLQSK